MRFLAGIAFGYMCRDIIYEVLYKAEQAIKTDSPTG